MRVIRILLLVFAFGLSFNSYAQHYPNVLNLNHIVISGQTLVSSSVTATYTADFFYPGETSNITWSVENGTIISQNTNPANGPISVTITWNAPGIHHNYGDPLGYVLITQGTSGHLQDPYQAAALPVYAFSYLANGCSIYPTSQTISMGQLPCLISGATACDDPSLGYTYIYQWQVFNDGLQIWTNISGANGSSYQPPAASQDATYRRVTLVINRGTVINTYTSTESTVIISRLMPGRLTAEDFVVYYGDALPAIADEMPYGGNCTSGNYTFVWEVSYNGKPWQVFGSSVHCPSGIVVKKESVRIRRSVQCGPSKIYTNILEFKYVYNSLNVEANQNYLKQSIIKTRGIESFADADQLQTGARIVSTTYFNGAGVPIQIVSKETGTPTATAPNVWQDIVSPIQYDEFQRQPKQYLPYVTTANPGAFKTDPYTPQAQYYQTFFGETPAYGQTAFESSPLGRPVNVKKPGSSWAAGPGENITYGFNESEAIENVRIWDIDYLSGSIPTTTAAFPALTLYKRTSSDNKGKLTIEYTDKSGRVVLTKVQVADNPSASHAGWLCTYNVFDDYGHLRFVIPPKAVEYLDANGWTFNNAQNIVDELCSKCEYDYKGRNILKKAPGAGEVLLFYDDRDRIVLTQDANQRVGKYSNGVQQWGYYYYDQYDREVLRGILDNSTTNISGLRFQIEGIVSGETTVSISTSSSESIKVYSPVTQAALLASSNTSVEVVTYYDAYTFAGVSGYDNDFDNYLAHNNTDPDIGLIVRSTRVSGLNTGKKVRVIGTSTFLTSTVFYDEEGNAIQTNQRNIKQGNDVTTNHYHFDGRLLSTFTKHSASGTAYTGFRILTKYDFDKIGRTTSISKKIGAAAFKEIATYGYDEFGRIKTKRLAPGYTGTGKTELETLTYSYDLNNQLTGINKNYALKEFNSYNKWSNFFGLHLGYNNKEIDGNGNHYFAKADLDGLVTGLVWTTQGDDMQRKYDFEYDHAGRLTKALFKQRVQISDPWGNASADFSVGGFNGGIEYDANGNILAFLQKGILPGKGVQVIDDLRYTYFANGTQWTNKLQKVKEDALNTLSASDNGKLGDFKDGTNGANIDYDYDPNGNLSTDLNKDIKNLIAGAGIKYNYLDKPEEVKVDGGGTVKFVYDAVGRKLQKILTVGSGTPKTYSYIDGFLYENDDLQYISFEEGRIRVVTPVAQTNSYGDFLTIDGNVTLPGNKKGVFDYFLRDHLGNVRVVVTEEVHDGRNICTMEDAPRAAVEEPIFGQVLSNGQPDPAKNEVLKSRYPRASIANNEWSANTSTSVSQLANLGNAPKLGPNTILKVMAGDIITTQVDYYYKLNTNEGCGSTSSIVQDVVANLLGVINNSSPAGILKGSGGDITNMLNQPGAFTNFLNTQPCSGETQRPRAYLTLIFFDEQFNFVGEGSTFRRVFQDGHGNDVSKLPLQILNVKAPKNGYAYVYVSNESPEYVYFDQLQVKQERGRIVEENHYYPFGLRIAGISSHKLEDQGGNEGRVKNDHLYNDKELVDDLGLNWYDYGLREYDAQICRFFRVDPLTDDYPFWSPYQYAGNEPIANMDLDGAEQFPRKFGEFTETFGWLPFDPAKLEDFKRFKATPLMPEVEKIGYRKAKTELSFMDKLRFASYGSNPAGVGIGVGVIENIVETAKSARDLAAIAQPGVGAPKNALLVLQIRETAIEVHNFVTLPDALKGKVIYDHVTAKVENFVNADPFDQGRTVGHYVPDIVSTAYGIGAMRFRPRFFAGSPPPSRVWEVGLYKDLRGVEAGLDAHHVPQKALAKQLISGYDPMSAPSILVPKSGHTIGAGVLSRSTSGITTARQLLARDIFELRRVYPNIPNSVLEDLIGLNKTMYPGVFKKP